ncbi:SDR family oxidoreductase [Nonomuraea sp. NPDC049504]|uniref:SDR family NAD(P)-dependent oxidoreductase n=1 Tax=Nonomuraea sp. NPDC049504 TaxID=3154729 RepID=UPI00342A3F97
MSGRVAIVTGAGPGVGAAVSRALSESGASVVLAARGGRAVAGLAGDIIAAGGHAVAVSMDVTDPVSMQRLVEQTLGAFGRLDAAFNHLQAQEVSVAMRHQIPAMRRANGGHIINLASGAGRQAAVIELTRTTALNVADPGLRINAIAAEAHASAEEIGEAVVWLCSDYSPLVTGATLYLPRDPMSPGQ